MKKVIVIALLLIVALSGYSQKFAGVDFSTAITPKNDYDLAYEKLTKLDGGYMIPFALTPVGLKHCIEKFSKIMEDNNLLIDDMVVNDVLLADYVNDVTDYSNFCTSLRVGSSELKWSWVKDGWVVGILLDNKVFAIMFGSPKK